MPKSRFEEAGISEEPAKVSAWKPCLTIFCGLPSRASFLVTVSMLPEAAWENAARKVIEKVIKEDFSTDPTVSSFHGDFGTFTCLDAKAAPGNGKEITSCLDSTLDLTSTFLGVPGLKEVYLRVLRSAHKVR